MRSPDTSLWMFLLALTLSAFGLNWLWEMFQMPAYTEMAERSWAETALPCAFAALSDVAMTLAIYGIGCLAAGNWRWGVERTWNIYLTGTLLAGLFATALEWKFLGSGRWSYNERMPIVPILGIGLWPLMQLMLLVPLSWFIAAWCSKRVGGESTPGKPDVRSG
ncbi:MAG: hypothetical protein HYX68_16620 [Planctomycetes bacterium]|nr:hypothetical protein [Planctomycetota bacterium]